MLRQVCFAILACAAVSSCKTANAPTSDVLSTHATGKTFQYICHFNGDMVQTNDIGIDEIDNGQIFFYAIHNGVDPKMDRYPFELKGTGGVETGSSPVSGRKDTRIITYRLTAADAATMILQTPTATGNPDVGPGLLKVDATLFSNGPTGNISFNASGDQGIEGDTSVVYQCTKAK